MSYKYVYTQIAFVEMTDALDWYSSRSRRAAENFVIRMNEKIAVICKDPFRFKCRYKQFRETSLSKYPFYIIYFVDEEKHLIVISSIYHHKRNPSKKYK